MDGMKRNESFVFYLQHSVSSAGFSDLLRFEVVVSQRFVSYPEVVPSKGKWGRRPLIRDPNLSDLASPTEIMSRESEDMRSVLDIK